jgi:hypothetical protein
VNANTCQASGNKTLTSYLLLLLLLLLLLPG